MYSQIKNTKGEDLYIITIVSTLCLSGSHSDGKSVIYKEVKE